MDEGAFWMNPRLAHSEKGVDNLALEKFFVLVFILTFQSILKALFYLFEKKCMKYLKLLYLLQIE